MKRLQIAAWVLLGQIVGYVCAAMLLSIVGLSSRAFPFLTARIVEVALYIATITTLPILFSWLFVRRCGECPNRIVVCIVSYVFALSSFVWLVRATDGSMRAVGIWLPRALVLLPIASIAGSILGLFGQLKVLRRAG